MFASVADFENDSPGGPNDSHSSMLGGSVGAGLDWFPARRVSLGGHAGIGVQRTSSESGGPPGVDDFEATVWSLRTFTAAIQVQLFL